MLQQEPHGDREGTIAHENEYHNTEAFTTSRVEDIPDGRKLLAPYPSRCLWPKAKPRKFVEDTPGHKRHAAAIIYLVH